MAERDTFVAISDGDQLNEGYFNGCRDTIIDTSTGHDHDGTDSKFIARNRISQIYTADAFDSSRVQGDGSGTTSNSYEFTQINASDLIGINYIEISITGTANTNFDVSTVKLTIETKDVGGSYADSLPITNILSIGSVSGGDIDNYASTFSWIHTLTNDEKTNGILIKVTSSSYVDASANTTASFTNIQTVITRLV